MIITIDGPAAAGKGTLASLLAKKYNLAYFDTGMIYRAVGLEMLLAEISPEDKEKAFSFAQNMTFSRMMSLSANPDFRSAVGGKYASVVSAYPDVRQALLKLQQDFSKNPTFADGTPAEGAIYDGRDTGTVVCPHADVKFFVTASPEVRAQRRFAEFQQKGSSLSLQEVLEDIKARDKRDSERATAPMKPAEDAVIFDTSSLSIDEVFEKAVEIIDLRKKTLEK